MSEPGSVSLLLEIGTEEIPARFLSPALGQLREKAVALLGEYALPGADIRTFGTPRRLVLRADNIPAVQEDRVREVVGPPKKAAFDASGNPTRAAIGFAASQGIAVGHLEVRQREKGEYVVAIIEQKGVPARDVLPEVLGKLVLSLNFPKSMRWGSGSLRFVRPIHWILALANNEVVPFEIDGVPGGNITKGHRFLSPGAFVVREISSYVHLMENNYVIVDPDERRRAISDGIGRIAASVDGIPVEDDELLDTVSCLTEYPVSVLCEFPSEYLRLPKELLVTVMRDHQKFFAVEDEQGRLKHHFIVVSNTKEENSETVRAGAERVIRARFEDARFYYTDDLKAPLHSRIEALKRVTFHDRIGSLHDKTERIVRISGFLAGLLAPQARAAVERAAWLSKTDLLTGVVGEFPELQGLMGMYYATHDGEERAVASALREQYLPAYSGGLLPECVEGAILSLADKMDSVVSFFAIGLTPSGSEDPFALRRQALGVIAIIMERGYPVALRDLIGNAADQVHEKTPTLPDDVLQFFVQRLEPLFSGQGNEGDVIQSVLHLAGDLPLAAVRERLAAVSAFTKEAGFNPFLTAIKRANNIIPKADLPALDKAVLREPAEMELHEAFERIKAEVADALKRQDAPGALKSLSGLTGPVHSFFDRTLVMDKDEAVRLNRLALLKAIWELALGLADFSKLGERNKA